MKVEKTTIGPLGDGCPSEESPSLVFLSLSSNPTSAANIRPPNDTWRRGRWSKYRACSWAGKAGFYQCPLWHQPKSEQTLRLPTLSKSQFPVVFSASAGDEHYVPKWQIQLVWIILIIFLLHSGMSSHTGQFFSPKSLYVEKQSLMMNLYLAAEVLEWPDVWKQACFVIFYHILLYSNIQQAWVHSVKLTLGIHKKLIKKTITQQWN